MITDLMILDSGWSTKCWWIEGRISNSVSTSNSGMVWLLKKGNDCVSSTERGTAKEMRRKVGGHLENKAGVGGADKERTAPACTEVGRGQVVLGEGPRPQVVLCRHVALLSVVRLATNAQRDEKDR